MAIMFAYGSFLDEKSNIAVDTLIIAFSDMLEAYEALRSDETGKKPKTTKEGFLHNIMVFLQNQGLVEYVEHDETVMTTKKLDNFMDWNLLNQNNFERVLKILGENDNGND